MQNFIFCTELVVHGPVTFEWQLSISSVRPLHRATLPKHNGFIVKTNYIERLLTNALNNIKYLPTSRQCSHLYPLKPQENLWTSGFCRG